MSGPGEGRVSEARLRRAAADLVSARCVDVWSEPLLGVGDVIDMAAELLALRARLATAEKRTAELERERDAARSALVEQTREEVRQRDRAEAAVAVVRRLVERGSLEVVYDGHRTHCQACGTVTNLLDRESHDHAADCPAEAARALAGRGEGRCSATAR